MSISFMRFAALSFSLEVNLSVTVCLCLTGFVCFVLFMPTLRYSALLAISALPFLFFSLNPLDLARPTPCRYVSSYFHYLSVSPPLAPRFVQILSPHFFCLFIYLFIYLFLFFWGVEITIYTFDVLHHHNFRHKFLIFLLNPKMKLRFPSKLRDFVFFELQITC